MNTVDQLRELLRDSHRTLEENMGELTAEQAHWIANLLSPSALYAHVVMERTMFLSRFVGGFPPSASHLGRRTGVGGAPEDRRGTSGPGASDRHVIPPQYAHAVYGRTDEYLASLSPEDRGSRAELAAGLSWTLGYVLPSLAGTPCARARSRRSGTGAAGLFVLGRADQEGRTETARQVAHQGWKTEVQR
jgi:hypothetical protein